MTDWIEWRGGECPVSADTVVEVKMRGDLHDDPAWRDIERAKDLRWDHRRTATYLGSGDIIAYRIVKEAA